MADVAPKKKTTPRGRIAQCIRHLGAAERGVKVVAWGVLVRTMESDGSTFNDIGNWIDDSERTYSEEELQEFGQAHRAEGVEAGIKIGMARAASNGRGNGHLSLPPPKEMAEFCNDRLSQLKDDAQRKFVTEMFLITRRGLSPQRGSLGYLISIYVKHGGKT